MWPVREYSDWSLQRDWSVFLLGPYLWFFIYCVHCKRNIFLFFCNWPQVAYCPMKYNKTLQKEILFLKGIGHCIAFLLNPRPKIGVHRYSLLHALLFPPFIEGPVWYVCLNLWNRKRKKSSSFKKIKHFIKKTYFKSLFFTLMCAWGSNNIICYEMTSRYLCSVMKNSTSFQNKLSKLSSRTWKWVL